MSSHDGRKDEGDREGRSWTRRVSATLIGQAYLGTLPSLANFGTETFQREPQGQHHAQIQ